MKDKKRTSPDRVANRSPPSIKSGEQQIGELQEFAHVLGRLLGQRWLRQQADREDTMGSSPAKEKCPTEFRGTLDGESE